MSKNILIIAATNPAAYPPLERMARLLSRKHRVSLLGRDMPLTRNLRFEPAIEELTERVRTRQGLLGLMHFYVRAGMRVLRSRPDLVWLSDYTAAPLALFLPGPFIYQEHDLPHSHGLRKRLWSMLRRLAVARAALSVTANEERRHAMSSELSLSPARPVSVIWNVPVRQELVDDIAEVHDTSLKIAYVGNLSPDLFPPPLLAAAASVPEKIQLRLIGYAWDSAFTEHLLNQARELELELEILEAAPHHRMLEAIDGYHVGVAHYGGANPNHQSMLGASNKLFDYMSRGLAVLCDAGSPTAQFVQQHGCGTGVDFASAVDVSAALTRLIQSPEDLTRQRCAALEAVRTRWNLDELAPPVLAKAGLT